MKLTFDLAPFVEAARALRQIPSSSVKIDILDHARLHAAKGLLTLTMSDLDMEGSATVPCDKGADCLAAIPRAVLDFFVARNGGEPKAATLEFDAEMRQVIGRHGAARITMPILPGTDFPMLSTISPEWSFKVRAHIFCRALKRCEKAVATNESQIQLLGAFLHRVDGALLLIGADGHRLHLVDVDAGELEGAMPTPENASAPGVMIPARAIREIQSVFSGDESEVTVSGTDGLIAVQAERLRLTSKLIDAIYLDYRKFVQFDRPEPHVVISTDRLVRALDGLTVVPKTEAKGKRIAATVRMVVQDGYIELSTRGDTGDGEERIDAENKGIEPGTAITFHPPLLRDGLNAIEAKTVTVHPPEKLGMPFHLAGAEDATILISQRRL